MQKIKVNDEVIVIAGKNKGKKGKITKLDLKNQEVIITGLNMVKKATRPSQANPAGGLTEKEAPIHLSNVSLISPKSGKATRVKITKKGDKKVRTLVSCGTVLEK